MLQNFYRGNILAKIFTAKEMVELDTRYQAAKAPTANNLGQKTFDQLVEAKVIEVLKREPKRRFKHNFHNSKNKGVKIIEVTKKGSIIKRKI